MERYFSEHNLERLRNDFCFLIEAIRKSFGELDLRLRGSYFNLYYKGNSLAKVNFNDGYYAIYINKKFTKGVFDESKNFKTYKNTGDYCIFIVKDPRKLRSFFQKKHLDRISSNIKKVNYGEEIAFEQMLITDNRDREDLIIIDRQVTETALRRKRIDLLALKKAENGKFMFLVIEVKLGNNKELQGKVAEQLQSYINHIKRKDIFLDWKRCYEKVYEQMKELGLFDSGPVSLEIIENVKGLVLVGRYSGMAQEKIELLRKKYKDLDIKPLVNEL